MALPRLPLNTIVDCVVIPIYIVCFSQGSFKRSVEKYLKTEKAKLSETKAGWYTETAMATILKKTALGPQYLELSEV